MYDNKDVLRVRVEKGMSQLMTGRFRLLQGMIQILNETETPATFTSMKNVVITDSSAPEKP